MSTLKVTNIAGLTGSSTNVIEGLAKAWADLNGTGTPAYQDSYNFSSVTDNSTGNYTMSFTNSMGNANFAPSGVSGETSGTEMWEISTRATGSFRIDNYKSDTGSSIDSTLVAMIIHGDLA